MSDTARCLTLGFAAVLAAGCGTSPTLLGSSSRTATLSGWTQVDDAPGIASLEPDLSGLEITASTDLPALVRGGDAIRATKVVFATQQDAAAAKQRATTVDYARVLEREFPGTITGRTLGGGYRLTVPRPAEPGSDTVQLIAVQDGRTVSFVELVSAYGFPPELRDEALAAISR